MKHGIRSCICLIVAVVLTAALCTGCTSSMYSGEQHLQRITARAEERFLGEGSEYTGLEVYPVYNEYDELKYALIEFAPQGFLYVSINDQAYPWRGMYTLSSVAPESWMPYRVKEGAKEAVLHEDGSSILYDNREFFRDENGHVIFFFFIHFKVAGIENERRYFLGIISTADLGANNGLIPAVKRGEQYLDLVDGALIDYTPGMEAAYAIADIGFINKSNFDL